MARNQIRGLVLVGAVLYSGCLFAADFAVAGVKIDLPGDGWAELEAADKELAYGGDIQGRLEMVRKTFAMKDKTQRVQAVVVVESSASTIDTTRGQMRYSPKCEGTSDFYADGNSGFNRPYAKCLRITKLFNAPSIFKAFAPDAHQRLVADGATVPEVLRAFSAHYANSYGSFLTVSVLVPPDFPGLGEGDVAKPPGIGEVNIRWGDALMDVVEGGLSAFSSKVKLPAFGL